MAIGFFTGSGGGVDTSVVTAEAGDVLSNKVIVDANGNPLTGTMPDNGAISQSLGINGSFIIPQGFHNGSGEVFQSVLTMGAQTITPSGTAQTVACNGKYMTGNITVNAANVSKVVTGTVTSSSSTKTFTLNKKVTTTGSAYQTKYMYYCTVTLSGFKQILGVSWFSLNMCGHAASTTLFEIRSSDYALTIISGGVFSVSSIVFPVAEKSRNTRYWVYGIAA